MTRTGKERVRLPVLILVVSASTMVACIGSASFMGYSISGYAWAIPLFVSVISFFRRGTKVCFPYAIWIPWVGIVAGYLIFAEAPHAMQRSIMLLCPLLIGITISKFRIGDDELSSFRALYRYMAVALSAVVVLKTGMLITGTLPKATGLAAEVMTGSLLCTLFAASYLHGRRKDLFWWAGLALIPVIAVTRAGIIASGLTLPLTFGPMKLFKRVIFVMLIIVAGLGLFQTERIQQKMFYSGSGTIGDVTLENPDFATGGRTRMWESMQHEIDKMPWFGHGANASEPFVVLLTGGLAHPHNDWLRLQYDYGYVGTAIFGLTVFFQVLHLLKMGRRSSGERRVLFFAGATSFVVFCLFMFTDNIILYAAFFGNFQFTMIGLAYAAYNTASLNKTEQDTTNQMPLYRRISW